MPIFTLREEFEHGGRKYPAGQVEASDSVYLAARAAGVIGQPAPAPTPTATNSDAETQTERTVPRRERAKNGGEV